MPKTIANGVVVDTTISGKTRIGHARSPLTGRRDVGCERSGDPGRCAWPDGIRRGYGGGGADKEEQQAGRALLDRWRHPRALRWQSGGCRARQAVGTLAARRHTAGLGRCLRTALGEIRRGRLEPEARADLIPRRTGGRPCRHRAGSERCEHAGRDRDDRNPAYGPQMASAAHGDGIITKKRGRAQFRGLQHLRSIPISAPPAQRHRTPCQRLPAG